MAGNASEPSQPKFSQTDLPELLNQYYKRLFPYKYYYQWLSYGNVPKSYFPQREFSFTLKDDVYIRYQSFADAAEMEKEIQKRNPYKIDIGAVFTHKPKDHKMVKPSSFQAEEKELVFDIDMTDYDEVRTCCQGAEICMKCWPFMTIAMKIIDKALEEDFGFQHRLWVYSGRRGVHCWVCDEAARKLSQNARSAVAEYLSIVKGGENQLKKVTLRDTYHPSIQRALEILKKDFECFVENQEFLSCKERWEAIIGLVALKEDDKMELSKRLSKSKGSSVGRWRDLESLCENKKSIDEIMLQHCYPRLDVNVTKGLNHLLKSPFCVHPKTGRVCVPIDIKKVDSFDPFSVPTISTLCNEIDEYDRKNAQDDSANETSKKKIAAFKKTSLLKPLETFKKFLEDLEKENNERRKRVINEEEKKCNF